MPKWSFFHRRAKLAIKPLTAGGGGLWRRFGSRDCCSVTNVAISWQTIGFIAAKRSDVRNSKPRPAPHWRMIPETLPVYAERFITINSTVLRHCRFTWLRTLFQVCTTRMWVGITVLDIGYISLLLERRCQTVTIFLSCGTTVITKVLFIATQLNSTRRRVELSWVALL